MKLIILALFTIIAVACVSGQPNGDFIGLYGPPTSCQCTWYPSQSGGPCTTTTTAPTDEWTTTTATSSSSWYWNEFQRTNFSIIKHLKDESVEKIYEFLYFRLQNGAWIFGTVNNNYQRVSIGCSIISEPYTVGTRDINN